MEFCPFGSLETSFVDRYRRTILKNTHEDIIAYICKEILNGLRYLHSKRIIHRDVKCSNILIDRFGRIKLGDLGIATELPSGAVHLSSRAGSPHWMAPEILSQAPLFDFKADIWSLGITILEIVHGEPPLAQVEFLPDVIMHITQDPAPRLNNEPGEIIWSDEFKEFISMCLSKSPNRRPSAEQLLSHPFILKATADPTDILNSFNFSSEFSSVTNTSTRLSFENSCKMRRRSSIFNAVGIDSLSDSKILRKRSMTSSPNRGLNDCSKELSSSTPTVSTSQNRRSSISFNESILTDMIRLALTQGESVQCQSDLRKNEEHHKISRVYNLKFATLTESMFTNVLSGSKSEIPGNFELPEADRMFLRRPSLMALEVNVNDARAGRHKIERICPPDDSFYIHAIDSSDNNVDVSGADDCKFQVLNGKKNDDFSFRIFPDAPVLSLEDSNTHCDSTDGVSEKEVEFVDMSCDSLQPIVLESSVDARRRRIKNHRSRDLSSMDISNFQCQEDMRNTTKSCSPRRIRVQDESSEFAKLQNLFEQGFAEIRSEISALKSEMIPQSPRRRRRNASWMESGNSGGNNQCGSSAYFPTGSGIRAMRSYSRNIDEEAAENLNYDPSDEDHEFLKSKTLQKPKIWHAIDAEDVAWKQAISETLQELVTDHFEEFSNKVSAKLSRGRDPLVTSVSSTAIP